MSIQNYKFVSNIWFFECLRLLGQITRLKERHLLFNLYNRFNSRTKSICTGYNVPSRNFLLSKCFYLNFSSNHCFIHRRMVLPPVPPAGSKYSQIQLLAVSCKNAHVMWDGVPISNTVFWKFRFFHRAFT